MRIGIEPHFDIFCCYLRSASALHAQGIDNLSKPLGNANISGYYFITAFFLYRHTLELAIKSLLKEETGKDIIGHNIKELWKKVQNWQDRIPAEIQNAFSVLEKHRVLEDAQLFRYHVDKKGFVLQDILPIDQKDFEVLDRIVWAVYSEILMYVQNKKGLPPR